MSGAFTSAGSKIFIAPNMPGVYNQAGFEAIDGTFLEVGEVTDLGEFGREYNLVTHNPLGDRRTVKRKGSYNDGALSLSLARVPTDVGQAQIVTARDSDNSFPFKVVLQDNTILYFSAQVMSYTTGVGSVDQITGASVSVEIDNDIIEIIGATTFTITYVAGANGSIIGDPVQVVVSGGSTDPVYAAADSGFAFSEWTEDSSTDNPRSDTNVLANATYTATFV